MTHTRTPIRRTATVLVRTLAAGSLAGLAVAAFAAPAQASSPVDPDDKIWSTDPDFQAPYSVGTTGHFLPPWSVRITGDELDNREFSVRITGDELDNREWSVRITGDELDNRDMSVRITGDEADNRDFSVRITELKKFNPDNRDMSVRITGVTPDNRDY
jgi:hypothetical protein